MVSILDGRIFFTICTQIRTNHTSFPDYHFCFCFNHVTSWNFFLMGVLEVFLHLQQLVFWFHILFIVDKNFVIEICFQGNCELSMHKWFYEEISIFSLNLPYHGFVKCKFIKMFYQTFAPDNNFISFKKSPYGSAACDSFLRCIP